jgi:hypothetical protein
MKAGGGKAKGAQFEREVCKALSLWISDGKREDIFWRSAMSGGRATVAAKRGAKLSAQVGDISAVDPMGAAFIAHNIVECKYYRNLKLQTLFTGGKGGIFEFWKELEKSAIKNNKTPILVFKQNGMEPWVMTRASTIDCVNRLVIPWKGAVGEVVSFIPFKQFLAILPPP